MTSVQMLAPSDGMCDNVAALAWQHRTLAPRRTPVHPLVILSAKKRLPEGQAYHVEEGRLGSWNNSSRLFHMTHIAKTGGRSVRVELQRLVKPVAGAEQCYAPFVHQSRINIVFFREPRSHALSMYLHGAYAGRAARRRAAGYPFVRGDDMAGFGSWVSHFGIGWTPSRGDFYGYNPLNMQARTLTCTDNRWNCDYLKECDTPCAHHVGRNASDAIPPLDVALAAVHTADFVGVLELLPESLCVVEYRKQGRLPAHCACPANAGSGAGVPVTPRIAHVMNSKRQRATRKVSARVLHASMPPCLHASMHMPCTCHASMPPCLHTHAMHNAAADVFHEPRAT